MGAAGDMLTAALVDLYDDKDNIVGELNKLGIPGVVFDGKKSSKRDVDGMQMSVLIHGCQEEAAKECSGDKDESHKEDSHREDSHKEHHHEHHGEHEHHEHHDHSHTHHHTSLKEVHDIISGIQVSDEIKDSVIKVYDIIAAAESKAHGVEVSQVHFHEVGMMDAIADVTAVCYLMNRLSPNEVIASVPHVGFGHVHCAHGIMDVPAPATANILEGMEYVPGEVEGELLTPTGAALIKMFVDKFVTEDALAELISDGTDMSTGNGIGKKDFEKPNCVRAILKKD